MTHAANLARVRDNIAHLVVRFLKVRIRAGGSFYASELRSWISLHWPGAAPESPGRILRDLRQRGLVDYVLVSRAQSLYRVVAVRG